MRGVEVGFLRLRVLNYNIRHDFGGNEPGGYGDAVGGQAV